MASKPTFQRMNLKGRCWFYPCTAHAIGVLNYKDGSEVRVCWACARKRSKIRRLRSDIGKSKEKAKDKILGEAPEEINQTLVIARGDQ